MSHFTESPNEDSEFEKGALDPLGADENGNGTKDPSEGAADNGRHRKLSSTAKSHGPACQACRRKKAKCSRQQPCSHCVENHRQCVYDEVTNKPGMRAGAIEQLTQRVITLENMFMGQGLVWQQVLRHLDGTTASPARAQSPSDSSLQHHVPALQQWLASAGKEAGAAPSAAAAVNQDRRPRKRRRPDNDRCDPPTRYDWEIDPSYPLPDDLVDSLVDEYFNRLHPWIPMLHVTRFREDLRDPVKRPSRSTILHAIVSTCLRFSQDPRVANPETRNAISKRSREVVILQSMEIFSVSNLQALIICAFDTIASGRGPSSWSIVGSMTRTVEQLHLGIEEENQRFAGLSSNGMISRITFLPPSKDWCEEEERRRVFWNVFLMDRFCSISTGWNLSLTNADARRRLPCEGGLWEEGERLPRQTPHFGVSDQSGTADPVLAEQRPEFQDQNLLGGFAYVIEATENLSLVTSFCLQETLDATRPQQVQMWSMKFKQLDLRLIQWKLFLPERWREACAVNEDGNMDPNLTLAHITHNTAVVLLHQAIAYPPAIWQSTGINFPSQSSAETCMAAATEVATISENYLRGTNFLANHQFAFCLFICGRILLTNATYFKTPLAAASFDSLVSSLREMAQRWDGNKPQRRGESGPPSNSLASKFASRLHEARERGSTTYDIRQAAYSENGGTDTFQLGWSPAQASASGRTEASSDSLTLAFPPLPQALQPQDQTPQLQPCWPAVTATSLNGMAPTPAQHNLPEVEPNSNLAGNNNDEDLEDIYAYLNGSYLPEQRISIYSQ